MDATTTPATQVATVKLLIGGKFVESKTTEWRDIVNPATQEVLAKVPFATAGRGRCRGRFRQGRLQDLAQDADRRARPHLPEVPAADPREHGRAGRDPHGRAGQDPARCRRRRVPRPRGGRARGGHRQPAARRAGQQRRQRRRHLHAAAAAGRLRRHHAVQLPGDDPAVDVPDGDRHAATPSCSSPPSRTRWSPMRLCELALEAGIPAGVLNVVHGGEAGGQRASATTRTSRRSPSSARPRSAPTSTTAPRSPASACNA